MDALQSIIGQEHVKRALEVAVAGGHPIILVGPVRYAAPFVEAANLIKAEGDPCPLVGQLNLPSWRKADFRNGFPGFDIVVKVPPPTLMESDIGPNGEKAVAVQKRVQAARDYIRRRSPEWPYNIPPLYGDPEVDPTADRQAYELLAAAEKQLPNFDLNVGVRVARTVANLDGDDHLRVSHTAEAAQYQSYLYQDPYLARIDTVFYRLKRIIGACLVFIQEMRGDKTTQVCPRCGQSGLWPLKTDPEDGRSWWACPLCYAHRRFEGSWVFPEE